MLFEIGVHGELTLSGTMQNIKSRLNVVNQLAYWEETELQSWLIYFNNIYLESSFESVKLIEGEEYPNFLLHQPLWLN